METIYFGTLLIAVFALLLTAILLYSQRRYGERSRIILSGVNLLLAIIYIVKMLHIGQPCAFEVLPVPTLLLGLCVTITYILYSVEVISPGWLNPRRLALIYAPAVALILLYIITQWLGVTYTPFMSLGQLLRQVCSFEVLFRIGIALLTLLSVVFVYAVPYTDRFCNTDTKWIRGFVTVAIANIVCFLAMISYDNIVVQTIYYVVSLIGGLYIMYQELFVRLMIPKN